MELVQCANKNETARKAGEFLTREIVHYSDRQTLILVSGGSSLSVFDYVEPASLRSNISLGQVDERFVKDERQQNAFMFRKTSFAKKTAEMGIPFFAMNVADSSSVTECALQYERYLKQWKSVFYGGVILAVLGVGDDGHIAGVLPEPETADAFNSRFYDTRSWVVGYETGGKGEYPARVTVSLHFLLQEVTTAFVYVCGKEKKQAVENIFSPEGTFAETPARIVNQMPSVFLFSDIT